MSALQSIHVKRFKCIEDAPFNLRSLNVIVGANNSGKSSIIQAFHFAIGFYQSMQLSRVRNWASGTISPTQLVYAPSDSVYSLHHGGTLVERADHAIEVGITLADGNVCVLRIKKGRNGNINYSVSNVDVAKSLAILETPFSVFSPGLAGVSRKEQFVSDGVILCALARGDANLVLRNILYRLSESGDFEDFMDDLHNVFPTLELRVDFNAASDEYIQIEVKTQDDWVPIELAGTGILQATQILSYIHRFEPQVIVLDEPDSHLHPNNQRLLCGLLQRIAEERDTQVILTTHSRHVVDALSGVGNVLWVRNSTVDVADVDDNVGILLDIGALDIKERMAVHGAKAIVLTEDTHTSGLSLLLSASGFDLDKTVVPPYHGVTNIKNLRAVIEIAKARQINIPIALHRDRDFLSDEQVAEWKVQVRNLGVEPFVTDGTDIESHLISPEHLAKLNPEEDVDGFNALVDQVTTEQSNKLVEQYVNGKTEVARRTGKLGELNHGALAAEASNAVADHAKNRKGKTVLRALRAAFRKKHQKNMVSHDLTEHLAHHELNTIARKAFRSN